LNKNKNKYLLKNILPIFIKLKRNLSIVLETNSHIIISFFK